jgi:hypothetical protein
MTSDDPATVLARLLGLTEDRDSLPGVYAEARKQLAATLRDRRAARSVSIEEIAAYADGAMSEQEKQAFQSRMLASGETYYEVTGALDFLSGVEARLGSVEAEARGSAASGVSESGASGASETPAPVLTTAEMVSFLKIGFPRPTPAQKWALRTDPKLRAEFERIKNELAIAAVPAVNAASSGREVHFREFPGGSVRCTPMGEGRFEVVVRFDPGPIPRRFLLQRSDGEMHNEPLTESYELGEIRFYRDGENPNHSEFLDLLFDPTSTGSLLP